MAKETEWEADARQPNADWMCQQRERKDMCTGPLTGQKTQQDCRREEAESKEPKIRGLKSSVCVY